LDRKRTITELNQMLDPHAFSLGLDATPADNVLAREEYRHQQERYRTMPSQKRHKWESSGAGEQQCSVCGLRRIRPASRIRRGRAAVSDWDYLIDGKWKRKLYVPPCEEDDDA
jgi:hypothetical protein